MKDQASAIITGHISADKITGGSVWFAQRPDDIEVGDNKPAVEDTLGVFRKAIVWRVLVVILMVGVVALAALFPIFALFVVSAAVSATNYVMWRSLPYSGSGR